MNKVFLNDGFKSMVYIIDDKFIQLEGKNEESLKCYRKLNKILNFINCKINCVQTPQIVEFNEKGNGILKYKIIKGKVLVKNLFTKANLDNIAKIIAKLLEELYEINIYEYSPNFSIEEKIKEEKDLINKNINYLLKYLNDDENENLKLWVNKYNNYLENFNDYHFTHGDLWYENFIISEDLQYLTGVIDWENACIHDIANDFCALLYLGGNFMDIVLNNYKYMDSTLQDRIKLYSQRRELVGLKYVVDFCDAEELEEQLYKIRNSGIIKDV